MLLAGLFPTPPPPHPTSSHHSKGETLKLTQAMMLLSLPRECTTIKGLRRFARKTSRCRTQQNAQTARFLTSYWPCCRRCCTTLSPHLVMGKFCKTKQSYPELKIRAIARSAHPRPSIADPSTAPPLDEQSRFKIERPSEKTQLMAMTGKYR